MIWNLAHTLFLGAVFVGGFFVFIHELLQLVLGHDYMFNKFPPSEEVQAGIGLNVFKKSFWIAMSNPAVCVEILYVIWTLAAILTPGNKFAFILLLLGLEWKDKIISAHPKYKLLIMRLDAVVSMILIALTTYSVYYGKDWLNFF